MAEPALQDRCILVVEDEFLLAEELAQELREAGAKVLGPASTMESAFLLLEKGQRPAAAILDVNLAGRPIYPLADALLARAVPLVFATGYDPEVLPERFARVPTCGKPIDTSRLLAMLGRAIRA